MPRSLADWLGYMERQHPREIEMGLDRAREVAERLCLARPGRQTISVAGTNGKGSTVAFIESIARAAGWRVGAYTSPHLFDYSERVRIDGRPAAEQALVEAFATVETARRAAPAIPLTYFEFGTLAALWLFGQRELDLAILEVGLGGRLDAVNLVDADVSVITAVDLDHQDWLGADREAIGREKAGIARAWKPLVLGEDDPPSSVLGHAYAIGASAIRAGSDFLAEPLAGGGWRWREVGWTIALPDPRLPGTVQRRNAATAIAALRALRRPLPGAAIVEGVATAALPARLQRLVHGSVEIVVDVAHNPQAARALADWLRTAPIAGRTHAVYAALADKDAAGMVAALEGGVDSWYLAGLPDAGPRAQGAAALAARLVGTAAARGSVHATVEAALAAALADAAAGDRVLVAGSFHTAAAALTLLQGRH